MNRRHRRARARPTRTRNTQRQAFESCLYSYYRPPTSGMPNRCVRGQRAFAQRRRRRARERSIAARTRARRCRRTRSRRCRRRDRPASRRFGCEVSGAARGALRPAGQTGSVPSWPPYSMARPTRARDRVLTFAFLLAVVTYLDRICISAAAPFMMEDLHLTVLDMSVVFTASTLACSLFEIPSGWLGDTRGPRRVLTRIVLWWSAFTMLTGAAQGFASLVSIRFLFGAGEAGAFPNIARSFSRWIPRRERG